MRLLFDTEMKFSTELFEKNWIIYKSNDPSKENIIDLGLCGEWGASGIFSDFPVNPDSST